MAKPGDSTDSPPKSELPKQYAPERSTHSAKLWEEAYSSLSSAFKVAESKVGGAATGFEKEVKNVGKDIIDFTSSIYGPSVDGTPTGASPGAKGTVPKADASKPNGAGDSSYFVNPDGGVSSFDPKLNTQLLQGQAQSEANFTKGFAQSLIDQDNSWLQSGVPQVILAATGHPGPLVASVYDAITGRNSPSIPSVPNLNKDDTATQLGEVTAYALPTLFPTGGVEAGAASLAERVTPAAGTKVAELAKEFTAADAEKALSYLGVHSDASASAIFKDGSAALKAKIGQVGKSISDAMDSVYTKFGNSPGYAAKSHEFYVQLGKVQQALTGSGFKTTEADVATRAASSEAAGAAPENVTAAAAAADATGDITLQGGLKAQPFTTAEGGTGVTLSHEDGTKIATVTKTPWDSFGVEASDTRSIVAPDFISVTTKDGGLIEGSSGGVSGIDKDGNQFWITEEGKPYFKPSGGEEEAISDKEKDFGNVHFSRSGVTGRWSVEIKDSGGSSTSMTFYHQKGETTLTQVLPSLERVSAFVDSESYGGGIQVAGQDGPYYPVEFGSPTSQTPIPGQISLETRPWDFLKSPYFTAYSDARGY